MTLSWLAPSATAAIARHEYRYKKTTDADYPSTWTPIPDSAPGGDNEAGFTVTGLGAGAHTFQVRAVSAGGAASEEATSEEVTPASAKDETIWSADLDVKTLNTAQDELGCSHTTPFNGQCANPNVLSDDDFSLHGNPYTITRIEDDGSELELTLDTALPSNVLELPDPESGR